MDFLLSRFRNFTVLVLVILAQILLLAYQVKTSQDVRLLRVWAVTAVTPLARVMEFLRRNSIGLVEDYFVLLDVREKNRQLNTEIGKLKLENQYLHSELQTADRVRALAAFQASSPSQFTAARIIGTGPGGNSRVVFIDRGTASGVEKGMAVVTPDGIVGKVVASYPTAAQVQLITDPNFAAGVISDKNRVRGTLKGNGHPTCSVEYVQNEEKVEVGEKFLTSGDDRVFPKGMPVGVVTVVRQGKEFYKEIFVTPSGLSNGLEEVLVVLQGVHQAIPDPQVAASQPVHLQPAPVNEEAQKAVEPGELNTDADKLRERYKKLGEAQGHVYGETGSGRVPNFNLDPNPRQGAPAARPSSPGEQPAGAAGTAQSTPPGTPPATPAAPRPRVDADGRPLPPRTAAGQPPRTASGQAPRTDAGQPPRPRPRVDADGNPLSPRTGAGQPPRTGSGQAPRTDTGLPPRPRPRVDADGNPLPPRVDGSGQPPAQKKVPAPVKAVPPQRPAPESERPRP